MNFFQREKKPAYDSFWVQSLPIKRVLDRMDLFSSICEHKKVLHFGCTDYPIFDPKKNLHIQLSEVAKELHGFDIDLEGIKELKKYVPQPYFASFDDIPSSKYDIVLIPETIEHVDNVGDFLQNLNRINAERFFITAPNCFAKTHMDRNEESGGIFTEIVHPDHNCWYSPYTLKNAIEKYSNLRVENVYLLNYDTMVCCEASLVK